MEKKVRRPFQQKSPSSKEGGYPFKKRTRAFSDEGERPRFQSRSQSKREDEHEERPRPAKFGRERDDRDSFDSERPQSRGQRPYSREQRPYKTDRYGNKEERFGDRQERNTRFSGKSDRFSSKEDRFGDRQEKNPRFGNKTDRFNNNEDRFGDRREKRDRFRPQQDEEGRGFAKRARPSFREEDEEHPFQRPKRENNFSSRSNAPRDKKPFSYKDKASSFSKRREDFPEKRDHFEQRQAPASKVESDSEESSSPTTDFIFGRNPVMEALQAGREINAVLIADGTTGLNRLIALAKERGIPIKNVNRQKLDQVSQNGVHQGVAASIAAYAYADWEAILSAVYARGETPFIVVLDHIEDPHNLGSILRSSDATGVHLIIIPNRQAVGLTSTVAKSSAGAIEHVPVARVGNIAQTIDKLKAAGLTIVGTDSQGAKSFKEANFEGPLALVIGSEGKGIRPIVANNCDIVVRIPLSGKVNSLNASVAAAVCLFEIANQRTIQE